MMKLTTEFEKSFFDEEVRCDYLVTQKQKKIWAVEIDLLSEFLRICSKYDIRVMCFAGTLLGAIRHKGYIPWDDDLDICMDRDNFEKLLRIPESEFLYPYFLQTALSDRKFFCGYARFRNSETTGIIKAYDSQDYNNGIYIDIYVMDAYIEDRVKLKIQLAKKKMIMHALDIYYHNSITARSMRSIVSYEKLYEIYVKNMRQFENDTNRVTLLTHLQWAQKRYYFEKKDFNEIKWVQFENIKVPISSNYDSILRHCYGNYNELPPIEERGKWHEDSIIFDPDIPYKEYYKLKA